MTLQEVEALIMQLYTQNYKEITGETPVLAKADPVALTLKSIALLTCQVMQYIDAKGRDEMLKTAQGEALDNLAALLGLTRKGAERATTTVRFTLAAVQNGAVAIPAGTRLRTENGIYFNTVRYAEVPAGQLTADVLAQAEKAGTQSSGLLPGTINMLVDPIAYVERVENTDISTGGTDKEDDDSLTERIYLAPSVYSCAGPKDAYEYYAKAFRNDVADVRITSPAACEVEIYFMLDGGVVPGEADRAAMEAYMREDAQRPMCDHVCCKAPEEIGYSIDVTYYIASSDGKNAGTIQRAVEQAVEAYKVWQRKLGRDINPTELIYRMREAGAKRVTVRAPLDTVMEETQIARNEGCSVVYGGMEND